MKVFSILLLSMILMLIGHFFKVRRWGQFIKVYENPDTPNLLMSIGIGHSINIIIPYRVGDIVRIILSGRKMKNGYTNAIATVFIDLYLDTIVVSFLFIVFCFFSNSQAIHDALILYVVLFSLIVLGTVILVRFKKEVKQLLEKICSLFNDRIKLKLLYMFWAVISAFKDIKDKLNRKEFIINTFGIWASYMVSYLLMSRISINYGYSFGDIFSILFTSRSINIITAGSEFSFLFTCYLVLPLVVVMILGLILRNKTADGTIKSENRFLLPQLSDIDKLAFLNAYFSNEDKNVIENYLDINKDVLIEKDLSSGSNAVTLLCFKENKRFFRKYAFGENGKKLNEQIEWIENHSESIKLCRIINKKIENNYCLFDMEYVDDSCGLFTFIHSYPFKEAKILLRKIINDLEKNLYEKKDLDSIANIEKYIQSKVTNNLDKICNSRGVIKQLAKYDTITINGVEYRNIKMLKKMFDLERLKTIFKNDPISDIHGDLTVENIICRNTDYYLIDPNSSNIHNTKFIDYAKLLQSLHGQYEFLMRTNYVRISDNKIEYYDNVTSAYEKLYKEFRKILEKMFSYEEMRSIYYHELINWLRLLPYKIEKNGDRAALFYAGFIKVCNDVEGMFNEE